VKYFLLVAARLAVLLLVSPGHQVIQLFSSRLISLLQEVG
jgi:hypothetical protein